jgi:hypothetical protein
MVAISSNDASGILFLLLIVLFVGIRAVRMARGAPASTGRLAFYAGIYLVLFVLFVVLDFAPLPTWYLGVEFAIVVVAAIAATPYVRKVAQIYENPPGTYGYRLGIALPIVYLVLFATRLTVELVVLGENPFASPPVGPPTSVTESVLILLALVDALFAFSTGLIVGRSAGVYLALRDHQAKNAGKPPAPPAWAPGTFTPPPSPPAPPLP